MAQHTPGPWIVRDAPYGFDIIAQPPLVDGTYERPLLWTASVTRAVGAPARSQFYPEANACAANAALIAAAPELLAALRVASAYTALVLEDMRRARDAARGPAWDEANDTFMQAAAAAATADAAIAKAEGRS